MNERDLTVSVSYISHLPQGGMMFNTTNVIGMNKICIQMRERETERDREREGMFD